MSLLRSALSAAGTAVDGAVAWSEMAASDFAHLRRTLDGNDLDAWDPDYIRRVLPLWRAVMHPHLHLTSPSAPPHLYFGGSPP